MPAKPLSYEQLQDASRLKNIYLARKEALGLTQAVLADHLGFANQSGVSQYLNGKIPLNAEVAVLFAEQLQCKVSDFSAQLQNQIDRLAQHASGRVWTPPPVTNQVEDWPFSVSRAAFDSLPASERKRIDVMVRSFVESFGLEKKRGRAAA